MYLELRSSKSQHTVSFRFETARDYVSALNLEMMQSASVTQFAALLFEVARCRS